MPYLIDTDICSYYLKGRLEEQFKKAGIGNIWVSRITVAELMVLAYHRNNRRFITDIDNIVSYFNFIDIDDSMWKLFSELKATILKGGKPPGESGDFDILQACIAKVKGFTIVTNNETHFMPLDVPFENWVK